MEVTEIKVNLTTEEVRNKDGVHAFVKIVFDNQLVVRDIRVMEVDGFIRLGMPSRKLLDPCPDCRKRVDLSFNFCSNCGVRFKEKPPGFKRSYIDLAHPLNQEYRIVLEQHIAKAYNDLVDPRSHLQVKNTV